MYSMSVVRPQRAYYAACGTFFPRIAANFAIARLRRSSNLASRRCGLGCETLSGDPGSFCEPAQPCGNENSNTRTIHSLPTLNGAG